MRFSLSLPALLAAGGLAVAAAPEVARDPEFELEKKADAELLKIGGVDPYALGTYWVEDKISIAINVVAETNDVWYHMSGPATHSWIGLGMGGDMTNTRMIITYVGANGHNLTNSCRMAYDHSEPVWEPDCKIDPVYTDVYGPFANTLSPGGQIVSHAICRGCAAWPGSNFDLTSQSQPMIVAFGPNTTLRSDDPAASIRFHQFHASFNFDMTKAVNFTGSGRIPAPNDPALETGDAYWSFASYYSSTAYSTEEDSEWGPLAHAICMIVTFFLVFPVGAIVLRYSESAYLHALVQAAGCALFLAGFGIAIYVSKMYNKSKNFNSAHQVIGLLIFATLFIQAGLGYFHHVLFKRTAKPSIMGKVHRFLGAGILVLAVVNGGIGWDFAGNANHNIPYAIMVVGVVIVLSVVYLGALRYKRHRAYRPEKEALAEYEMDSAAPNDMRYVQTPRTPRFGNARFDAEDDPENYQAFRMNAERYTDRPAQETAPSQ